jgi:hypothetical protein
MATTLGRGRLSPKSGQRVVSLSVFSESSAGCWTETKSVFPSGVKAGPQSSAPVGQAKKKRGRARPSPAVSAP